MYLYHRRQMFREIRILFVDRYERTGCEISSDSVKPVLAKFLFP